MTDDYSEYTTDAGLDSAKLGSLSNLVSKQRAAEVKVAALEAELKDATEGLRQVAEHEIPDLMDAIGVETITTDQGVKVTVKTTLRASVPVAQRAAAWHWLEENGHGALIKRSVMVAFNRDQEGEADQLVNKLQGDFSNVKTERKVEPSTLKAFIREQLQEGNPVPMDMFGAFEQRRAKLEEAK